MISREDAQRIVLGSIDRLPALRMPVALSIGHVLAKKVTAPLDQPPFDRSAMDGFAIAAGDRGPEFEIEGEVAAGQVYRGRVGPGRAVRIMTGAMVPAGTGRVIMKEHARHIGEDRIRVAVWDEEDYILRRGEDLRKGAQLYPAGRLITPVVLASLASSGVSQVSVIRRPRVGILVTGGELLRPGQRRSAGRIYDSNGPLLRSLMSSMDIEVAGERRAADSVSALGRAFSALVAKSDAVFITGGVSAGEYDRVPEALARAGFKIHFDRVAVQPGKPFTFATRGKRPVFAFPGNPVSVFVSYFLYVVPALYRMMGRDFSREILSRRFRGNFERSKTERELFLPVRFTGQDGVEEVGYNSSGDLYALSRADALMIVPKGKGSIKGGEAVKILELYS